MVRVPIFVLPLLSACRITPHPLPHSRFRSPSPSTAATGVPEEGFVNEAREAIASCHQASSLLPDLKGVSTEYTPFDKTNACARYFSHHHYIHVPVPFNDNDVWVR